MDHLLMFPETEIAIRAFVFSYVRGLIQAVYR